MIRRRPRLAIVVAVVALAACVPIGRYERSRAIKAQQKKIEHIAALTRGRPTAYRFADQYDCLLYRVGPNPYALELCYDGQGRLVEALDRRRGLHVGSLRYDPAAAPIRLAPSTIAGMLPRVRGVPPGTMPLGFPDTGPKLYPGVH